MGGCNYKINEVRFFFLRVREGHRNITLGYGLDIFDFEQNKKSFIFPAMVGYLKPKEVFRKFFDFENCFLE